MGQALKYLAVGLLIAGFVSWLYEPDPGDDAPRVLVSVDRTLWNRVGLNRLTYIRALRKAGMRPVLIDYDHQRTAFDANVELEAFDALLISGGGDVGAVHYGGDESISRDVKPERDELELALLDAAERIGMPMLGLCRGAQLLNVHMGGTLGDFREDSERYRRHKRIWGGHPVIIDDQSRLSAIYTDTMLPSVVTYHGQYVDQPGDGVRVVAQAPDGTPEAIEVATQEP
ncbi:MAG: gamma-glutamyl-gamma-aminobutyrate hydrolase family protein, partial [Xanthomonadales bacterium]|nr:gamma-glutamyl-gamma-aminobutyrate hydrolase family protein [Xanthomonadales bacterium]